MERKEGTKMSVWVDLKTKAEIERLSGKIGITPSTFCRNLVVVGLEEARSMEKIGILQAAVMFQELRERIRVRIEDERQRQEVLLSA